MRRIGHERGATAVITAIVIVMLVGFTAIAVDAGALYWDKKELQNGADAAALAVAQSCANDLPGCNESLDGEDSLSSSYATVNKGDENVRVQAVRIIGNAEAGSVTVEVTSDRDMWFAPVIIGDVPGTVVAAATASWGVIGGGTVLPITVSNCYFPLDATGQPAIPGGEIWLPLAGSTIDPNCHQGEHYAPGGWGWLTTDADCNVDVQAGDWVDGDTGKDVPTICKTDLKALEGQTVLVPVFDQTNDLSGNNADFHLVGFAQIRVVAYCFTPGNVASGGIHYTRSGQTPSETCTANNLFIRGIFEEMVDLGAELGDGDEEDYGARTVQLIIN